MHFSGGLQFYAGLWAVVYALRHLNCDREKFSYIFNAGFRSSAYRPDARLGGLQQGVQPLRRGNCGARLERRMEYPPPPPHFFPNEIHIFWLLNKFQIQKNTEKLQSINQPINQSIKEIKSHRFMLNFSAICLASHTHNLFIEWTSWHVYDKIKSNNQCTSNLINHFVRKSQSIVFNMNNDSKIQFYLVSSSEEVQNVEKLFTTPHEPTRRWQWNETWFEWWLNKG